MKIAEVLYDTAMDYYDLGKIAKAKGKPKVYEDYLNKAYILSREAAIKQQVAINDTIWKYVYLRSAAWLAIDCKKYEEAETLAILGLQGTPPPTEAKQFREILDLIARQKIKQTEQKTQNLQLLSFVGVLTSVDKAKSFIIINGDKPSPLKIWVSEQEVDDLVKLYWGMAVEGTGIPKKAGEVELKHIQKAA